VFERPLPRGPFRRVVLIALKPREIGFRRVGPTGPSRSIPNAGRALRHLLPASHRSALSRSINRPARLAFSRRPDKTFSASA